MHSPEAASEPAGKAKMNAKAGPPEVSAGGLMGGPGQGPTVLRPRTASSPKQRVTKPPAGPADHLFLYQLGNLDPQSLRVSQQVDHRPTAAPCPSPGGSRAPHPVEQTVPPFQP